MSTPALLAQLVDAGAIALLSQLMQRKAATPPEGKFGGCLAELKGIAQESITCPNCGALLAAGALPGGLLAPLQPDIVPPVSGAPFELTAPLLDFSLLG